MHPIQHIMYSDTTLYKSLQGNYVNDMDPDMLMPTRIKFMYDPKQIQIMYPGIYFVVPDCIVHDDVEELESALLSTDFRKRDSVKVSDRLISKFEKVYEPDVYHSSFNYFETRNNKLYIKHPIVGFIDDLRSNASYTDIDDPIYGSVASCGDISILIQTLFTLVSYGNIVEYEYPTIISNFNKLKSKFPESQVTLVGYNGTLTLGLYDMAFEFSVNIDRNLEIIYNLIHSFHNMEKDLKPYICS